MAGVYRSLPATGVATIRAALKAAFIYRRLAVRPDPPDVVEVRQCAIVPHLTFLLQVHQDLLQHPLVDDRATRVRLHPRFQLRERHGVPRPEEDVGDGGLDLAVLQRLGLAQCTTPISGSLDLTL